MLPPEGFPNLARAADLAAIAHLSVAVVYGTRDHAVDAEMTRELVGELRAAGVGKLLAVEVDGGRHDCEALVSEGVLERTLAHMLSAV